MSSPVPRGNFNSQQENNAIFKNAVDEIILTQRVSARNNETPEFLDSDYYANYLYEVDNMSLEETRIKLD